MTIAIEARFDISGVLCVRFVSWCVKNIPLWNVRKQLHSTLKKFASNENRSSFYICFVSFQTAGRDDRNRSIYAQRIIRLLTVSALMAPISPNVTWSARTWRFFLVVDFDFVGSRCEARGSRAAFDRRRNVNKRCRPMCERTIAEAGGRVTWGRMRGGRRSSLTCKRILRRRSRKWSWNRGQIMKSQQKF